MRSSMLHRLHDFAEKYKGDSQAADALMSFFRGECIHISDKTGTCELCGVLVTQRTKN